MDTATRTDPVATTCASTFQCSQVAQVAAAALSDHKFVDMCRFANEAGRKQLVEGMEALGYATIGGQANFVLSKVGDSGSF